jgi:hypothetical protein
VFSAAGVRVAIWMASDEESPGFVAASEEPPQQATAKAASAESAATQRMRCERGGVISVRS